MGLLNATPPKTAHTLRALAWLLRYPGAELRSVTPELKQALRQEAALRNDRLDELDALADRLYAAGLRVEAEDVELFDRGRRTALHLFEHVHGDSRDRGQAMVDLVQTYERAGLLLTPGELPDYLPVVLEFASTQPPAQAREFLRESADIVRTIFSALRDAGSPYASVLAAVLDLAGERAEVVPLAAEPAIDESWEEPAAFGGCSSNGQSRPNEAQPVHFVRPARVARHATS
jgi:nitrate reductase molybdenum cofactor assembly chaperone NarJ/NarW